MIMTADSENFVFTVGTEVRTIPTANIYMLYSESYHLHFFIVASTGRDARVLTYPYSIYYPDIESINGDPPGDIINITNIINNYIFQNFERLPVPAPGINQDQAVVTVPAGWKLLAIDTYSTSNVTISIGTTPGGDDIMSAVDCNGSYSTDKSKWSKLTPMTLYVSSPGWSVAVDFYFTIQRIV
jgi:hypothetical protein